MCTSESRNPLSGAGNQAAKAASFGDLQRSWMEAALDEARLAMSHDDVPVGAIVVKEGVIIGRGHNRREADNDPTAHAELLALAHAGQSTKSWRLSGAEMYVTLEPCPMCAFAMVLARLDMIVYALDDPKIGACGSLLNLVQFPGFDHSIPIRSGLLANASLLLMQEFFSRHRA